MRDAKPVSGQGGISGPPPGHSSKVSKLSDKTVILVNRTHIVATNISYWDHKDTLARN